MKWEYIDLADFIVIAERTLGVGSDVLLKTTALLLAASALDAPAASFGGEEFYGEPEMKAAVLCSRIVRNHPLVDGNKRVAFMSTVELLERNGYSWDPPLDEVIDKMVGLAGNQIAEQQLAEWIKAHLAGRQPS